MRNLKRALSLALASVMLLGMMVVGTSAASYPDVDDNDNVEAIEVLNAVQVMIGRQGNFEPDEAVNRHEMAVIMAKLVLGNETADNYVGTHPFTDVVSWADKYVAACYENNLISGTSATTYSGSQPLTAVQAALMMLRALGYEDLTKGATDWRAPVTAAANRIRLFDGVASNPSQRLTRNQVAQLALNTLESTMVDTKDNSLNISGGSGDNAFTITGGGGREYTVRASADARIATAISATEYQGTGSDGIRGWTLELGEHLYNGKLTNRNVTDEFGRPARAWGYNGKAIGTYIREELLRAEYTKGVTGRELYDLLGSAIINNYDFNIYMDGLDDTIYNSSDLFTEGAINRNNNGTLAGTGKGVLTQVFVETNSSNIGGSVTIALTNTYLAKANTDYNSSSDQVSLEIWNLTQDSNGNLVKNNGLNQTKTAAGEDFAKLVDAKKNDIFLVTVADGAVQSVNDPQVLSGVTVTSFSKRNNLTTGGVKYDYAVTARYDNNALVSYTDTPNSNVNLKDTTYNIYLDQYDYVIGAEEVDKVINYLFITGIESGYSPLVDRQVKANAIFTDGTMETITVNAIDSKNLGSAWQSTPTATDNAAKGHPQYDTTNAAGNTWFRDATINSWFTYTKNSNNVYTVSRVTLPTNAADVNGSYLYGAKAGQWRTVDSWDTVAAPKVIDRKSVALPGCVSGAYTNVYGNDDTIYLTASIKNIQWDSGKWNAVIDDVDGRTVGVEDTSIEVWGAPEVNAVSQNPSTPAEIWSNSWGVYTLFGDNGYIIAAVVVGTDGGVNNDYVYVHSNNTSDVTETYEDGKWTWTRPVLIDGKEVTLREVNDTRMSYLEAMDRYKSYRVTYKSDGTVNEVTGFDVAGGLVGGETSATANQKDDDVGVTFVKWSAAGKMPTKHAARVKANEVAALYGTHDVIVYHEYIPSAVPSVNKANTFFVTGAADSGIRVMNDTNVVFIQTVNNSTKTQYGTGAEQLESWLKSLQNNTNSTKSYDVWALIEDARATTVVVYDRVNNYSDVTPGGGTDGLVSGNVTKKLINSLLPSGGIVDQTGYTATQTAQKNYIKTLPNGAYQFDDVTFAGLWETTVGTKPASVPATNFDPSDIMTFKYVAGATTATLSIEGTTGPVYSESKSGLTSGDGAFFMVIVTDQNGVAPTTPWENAGNGSMKTSPLTAGTYTWTITSGSETFTGTFTVR